MTPDIDLGLKLAPVVAALVCGITLPGCGLAVGPQVLPALPPAERVEAARRFAESRRGIVSFAVIDTHGQVHCHGCRERHSTASVVKAMLLVAYLRRAGALSGDDRRLLAEMITVSSNEAADAIYGRLGDAPLVRLAESAGMEGFRIRGYWGNAETTALDQARFFAGLDELTPEAHRAFAREQLSSIDPEQSWGLDEAARPEWQAYFKGGWTPSRRGQLAHQAGRLERGGEWLAVAILTDASPTQAYGRQSVRGVAAALLGDE